MAECYICKNEILGKGEKDHFPVPRSLCGTMTWPICLSCHTLKDRVGWGNGWNPEQSFNGLTGLWSKASAFERLMLAKMLHIMSQGLASDNKVNSEIHRLNEENKKLREEVELWHGEAMDCAKQLDLKNGHTLEEIMGEEA